MSGNPDPLAWAQADLHRVLSEQRLSGEVVENHIFGRSVRLGH